MEKKDVMSARKYRAQFLRQKAGKALSLFGVYFFLIVMALVVLFPFYWMLISSVKTLDEYRMSVPTFWPRVLMLENYLTAFITANLGRLFVNTMIVGLVSTILSLFITILTAFAFARLEFKGKELLFAALLATMMIPGELFTITNYGTVTALGWKNTYTVLIVPFLVSVFYIYLLRQSPGFAGQRLMALQPALEHIRRNLAGGLSIPRLAELCGMSEAAFYRAFRACVGLSPKQYWLQLRLDKARQLLTDDTLSVADIAFHLGFCDEAHFCKLFRRYTGFTPGQYRRYPV